ncbi:MAG: class I SAM-dependent methyltransferase [Candidatus Heimdallarchaeota archaeon]
MAKTISKEISKDTEDAIASMTPEEFKQRVQQQAGKLLTQIAGYVATRTMDIGIRLGILEGIAKHPQGIASDALAKQLGLDPFYVKVWCNAAYAAELVEMDENQNYSVSPYVAKLLLDKTFPGYIGGIPQVLDQPEIFDRFAENLPTGERTWWDQTSPTFIDAVGLAGISSYTRVIPEGLSQIPGLAERLNNGGGQILELASGTGTGLIRMANAYPQSSLVGVDGDGFSLEQTKKTLQAEGLQERISLEHSWLEDVDKSEEFDMVLINNTMHECRDIDKVTKNVYNALNPEGFFVISDFPFPETPQGLRTVPGRIMSGIQFFEALIGDQLLSTQTYVDLLKKHGFKNVGSFDLTPVHVVVYGQK